MDLDQRIAQFENMAQADPENEMAHFSLGGAYGEAGRFRDAASSYRRCTELVPDMSRAYELAGHMLIEAGELEEARDILTRGYEIAAERGDLMPKRAIAASLKQLGVEVEDEPDQGAAAPGAAGGFVCQRTGRPGTKMDRPPFRGAVGQWICENISRETFDEWIAQGTKVINELRLDLSRDEDADTYDRYMREYLGIDDELQSRLTGRAGSGTVSE